MSKTTLPIHFSGRCCTLAVLALTITGMSFSTSAAENTESFTGPASAAASAHSSDTLASTVTIDFSGLVSGRSYTSYTQSGYTLSGLFSDKPCTTGCINVARAAPAPSKTMAVYASGTSTRFAFQRNDKASFSLKSVQFSLLNPKVGAQSVTFTGYLAGGGTVAHIVTTASTQGYQTYSFPSTFTNLSSVKWDPKYTTMTNVIAE